MASTVYTLLFSLGLIAVMAVTVSIVKVYIGKNKDQ